MRSAWIEGQREGYPLDELCRVLAVSERGDRAWTRGGPPERTRLTEAPLRARIRAIHAALKGAYGSPRMVRELRGRGVPASKERGERLRREHGIRARHKRRYKVTTASTPHLPVAANVLNRDFTPSAPHQTWTSDITYLWTDEGWLYLAIVLDLFTREVGGWSLQPCRTADIVTDALTMAWCRRKPAVGRMQHSDRGRQDASQPFQHQLREYGMICSMSRKGNCWDNAPTESWFTSFKNERVHGIRSDTRAAMTAASFEYIEVFDNRTRRHSTLGDQSPMQFLDKWRLAHHEEHLVA